MKQGFDHGFDGLSRIETIVVSCWLTWGAFGNGGVYCAMNNPFTLEEAAQALDRIGHLLAADALRAGSRKLFPNGQSSDREENDEAIFRYEDRTGNDPDDLFEEFAEASTDVTERLIEFIYKNWDETVDSDVRRMLT
ncbi:MAG: DUF4375 domain-containing protein [Planctomycetota bacterium]